MAEPLVIMLMVAAPVIGLWWITRQRRATAVRLEQEQAEQARQAEEAARRQKEEEDEKARQVAEVKAEVAEQLDRVREKIAAAETAAAEADPDYLAVNLAYDEAAAMANIAASYLRKHGYEGSGKAIEEFESLSNKAGRDRRIRVHTGEVLKQADVQWHGGFPFKPGSEVDPDVDFQFFWGAIRHEAEWRTSRGDREQDVDFRNQSLDRKIRVQKEMAAAQRAQAAAQERRAKAAEDRAEAAWQSADAVARQAQAAERQAAEQANMTRALEANAVAGFMQADAIAHAARTKRNLTRLEKRALKAEARR